MHGLRKATINLLMQAISAILQKRFGDGSVIKPSEGIHKLAFVDHRGCDKSTL
jgi:hypothetical protein